MSSRNVAAWNPYLDLIAKSLFVIGLANWLVVNEVTTAKGTISKFRSHLTAPPLAHLLLRDDFLRLLQEDRHSAVTLVGSSDIQPSIPIEVANEDR